MEIEDNKSKDNMDVSDDMSDEEKNTVNEGKMEDVDENDDNNNNSNGKLLKDLTDEQRKKIMEENEKILKERSMKNVISLGQGKYGAKIKEHFSNKIPTKEEVEKLKKDYEKYTKIIDPKTGKIVDVDHDNPVHRKELVLQNKVNLYLESNSSIWDTEKGLKKAAPKFRQVALKKNDIPKEIQLNGILPISHEIQGALIRHRELLSEIMVYLPWLALPVYTSNLILLLTGYKNPLIMSSSDALRMYIVTIKILSESSFVNNTVTISTSWIIQRLKEEKLTMQMLKEWCENVIFIDDVKNSQQFKELEKEKKKILSLDEILIEHSNNTLTEEHIDNLRTLIRKVNVYENARSDAGWANVVVNLNNGKQILKPISFCEEIHEWLESEEQELTKQFSEHEFIQTISKETDELTGWKSELEQNFIKLLGQYTVSLLRRYEMAILLLLDESCLTITNIVGIPKNYRSEFLTKEEIPNPYTNIYDEKQKKDIMVDRIHDDIKKAMCEERSEYSQLRNKNITNVNLPEGSIASEYGTTFQLYSLFKYLIFNDDDENDNDDEKTKEKMLNMADSITKDIKDLQIARIEYIKKINTDENNDETKNKKKKKRKNNFDESISMKRKLFKK